ncbi:hypothetical protein B0H11DRAFT_2192629 [Mycena galericulata]|nr:hypothetical protein B0H11DRAFT_2192629 [Mycena galericulata]
MYNVNLIGILHVLILALVPSSSNGNNIRIEYKVKENPKYMDWSGPARICMHTLAFNAWEILGKAERKPTSGLDQEFGPAASSQPPPAPPASESRPRTSPEPEQRRHRSRIPIPALFPELPYIPLIFSSNRRFHKFIPDSIPLRASRLGAVWIGRPAAVALARRGFASSGFLSRQSSLIEVVVYDIGGRWRRRFANGGLL